MKSFVGFIFVLGGFFFTAIGILILPNIFNYENKIDTTGTITRIVHKGEDSYDVYVSYTVDGVEYEEILGGYIATYRVGNEINIYYDEYDPKIIGAKSLNYGFLIIPILGIIVTIVGAKLLIEGCKEEKLKEELREKGILVNAQFIEVRKNYNYTLNNRHPYCIICEYFSSEDNQKYTYVSEIYGMILQQR